MKLEWLDKTETQMFQYSATDGELQRSYRPCSKKGPVILNTWISLWTFPCSHELLNRQNLHPVNSSKHLQIPEQAWVKIFPIVSQLSALPTVC